MRPKPLFKASSREWPISDVGHEVCSFVDKTLNGLKFFTKVPKYMMNSVLSSLKKWFLIGKNRGSVFGKPNTSALLQSPAEKALGLHPIDPRGRQKAVDAVLVKLVAIPMTADVKIED
jgi:hypothetical protein